MAKKTNSRKVAKKAKKQVNKEQVKSKKILYWRWIVISVPLIVALMWAIMLIFAYKDIPVMYDQASPSGIATLISLIFTFIVSYGAFVLLEFKSDLEHL